MPKPDTIRWLIIEFTIQMGTVTLSLDRVADTLNDVVFKKKIPVAKVRRG